MKGKKNVLYWWNHQQLFITDRIIDELTSSKISRELEKNYIRMPLTFTDGITNGLTPLESSIELRKNHTPMPSTIIDGITNGVKIHQWF